MIIDAHIHVEPPKLPGVGVLSPLLCAPIDERAAALRRDMADANVSVALAMGSLDGGEEDPLGIRETLQIAELTPGLHAIGVADPRRTEPAWLRLVEKQLAGGKVKALKAYLGYLHYGPDHANYVPYYELAERFKIPFFFHTGDTYSPCAKLKYARPLLVDEVAVDFPRVRFVLAHFGNPWLLEASEVVYKNVNVWADLSGLLLGSDSDFASPEMQEQMEDSRQAVLRAFRYAERPNRFLYGSDWPLAPMMSYRDFAASIIPADYHGQLFVDNARMLFQFAAQGA
jgi:predicted TIM-barrel fold metal-dependent hydrolase